MAWSKRDLLLAGSIAVNLVLVGFVVGAGARLSSADAPRRGPEIAAPALSTRALIRSLPEAERPRARREILGEGVRSAPLLGELREARREFEESVRAEPFDAEGARAALVRLRSAESELRTRSSELVITILADLPAEERARILTEMSERRRGFRRRGSDDEPRDRDRR
jgi:uncharacterized membrane protein